jgi:hypothetical protein
LEVNGSADRRLRYPFSVRSRYLSVCGRSS